MRSEARTARSALVRVNRRAKLPRASSIARLGVYLELSAFLSSAAVPAISPHQSKILEGSLASLFVRCSVRARCERWRRLVSAVRRIPLTRRPAAIGAFEFVVLSALRAAQLMRGCIPKVQGAHKLTTTAQWEVASGKIVNIYDASLTPPSLVASPDPAPALVPV